MRAYLDDLLCITKANLEDHLDKLKMVLTRLAAGLRINARKSSLCTFETEYLGYTLTRTGIKPQQKKVQAILAISSPKNVKDLRKFLGMVQYYKIFGQGMARCFEIYTDASSKQLGSVITQAQQKYSVTELELLAIVETLKEFKGMLWGQRLKVYTDHKNLIQDALRLISDRVYRWNCSSRNLAPKSFISEEHITLLPTPSLA
eukprot:CCRYP_020978-RA/>CCRYP_020978-RA protein AED:0.36 eAED:0.41 QI:0/0/0/1/0/0/3/0/202